jgi:superfamily II RNA helicase
MSLTLLEESEQEPKSTIAARQPMAAGMQEERCMTECIPMFYLDPRLVSTHAMAMSNLGPSHFKGFELSNFQRQAAAALDTDHNVLVAAPTGAGKTLVAEYAIHLATSQGKRSLYTAPIKALSNQKFRDFTDDEAIPSVGLSTGDISLQSSAQVLVMTTEILRNTLIEDAESLADVGVVVFDEVHFMDDPERGSVWEETLMFLPKDVVIVALSATIANLGQFAAWLERVRERPISVVEETKRPVPLKHYLFHPKAGIFGQHRLKQVAKRFSNQSRNRNFKQRDDTELLNSIIDSNNLPALYFCFSRKLTESKARRTARNRFLTCKNERKQFDKIWQQAKDEFKFDDERGAMASLRDILERGIGYHHAGMLPQQKEIVERLFSKALIKLLYTTETFAMGINMPARCVVFDSLMKFDGVDFDYMRTRDYLQMAGRAGRLGMDDEGLVYSVLEFDDVMGAPIHRIQDGGVEPITSRFNLDYATLVHLHGIAGSDEATKVWEKSFAAYQAREHSKKREERNRQRMRAVLKKRFEFLSAMGYIGDGSEILGRGRTSLHLFGYEIQLTEMLYEGIFENIAPQALSALVAATIHQGRPRDTYPKYVLRPIQGLIRQAKRVVEHAREQEEMAGLRSTIKQLDESMSAAIYEYANGCDFYRLEKFTSAAPGDFVRIARMTVQYLRHLQRLLKDSDPQLAETAKMAVKQIYRGPVDVSAELGLNAQEFESTKTARTGEESE